MSEDEFSDTCGPEFSPPAKSEPSLSTDDDLYGSDYIDDCIKECTKENQRLEVVDQQFKGKYDDGETPKSHYVQRMSKFTSRVDAKYSLSV